MGWGGERAPSYLLGVREARHHQRSLCAFVAALCLATSPLPSILAPCRLLVFSTTWPWIGTGRGRYFLFSLSSLFLSLSLSLPPSLSSLSVDDDIVVVLGLCDSVACMVRGAAIFGNGVVTPRPGPVRLLLLLLLLVCPRPTARRFIIMCYVVDS